MTAGPADVQLARIARGGAVNLAGSMVAGLSGFALTVIVTHGWDAATGGVLFAATSLFLILTATSLLGTDTGLARFLLRYEATGRGGDVRTLLSVALWPVIGISLVLAAALAGFAGQIQDWAGLPEGAVPVLIVLALVLPLTVLSDSTLAACQAFGKMRPTVLADRLLRSGGQPVAIALAAVLGTGLTGLALAWSLPYVLAAMVAPVLLLRTVAGRPAQVTQSQPPRSAAQIGREFWRYTWYRGIGRLFQVALQRADIILVAALRSPAEAALYTAATRFVMLGQLGVQAIQQVLQPRLAQLLALDDDAAVRRVFSTSTAWIMALSWPIYLSAVVAAPLYLRIFGAQYQDEGQLIVVLLGLGMLLAMAAGPVDVVLLMAGRSSLSLINNGVALAANIVLNLILIPAYGANGAAAAWAIALGVRNALPFWQVRRQLGLSGLSRSTAVVALAATGCFVPPMLVLRFTAGLEVLPSLLLLAACSVVYAALLWRHRDLLELAALRARRRPGGEPAVSGASSAGSRTH